MILYIFLVLFLIYIAVVYNSEALIFLAGVGIFLPLFLIGILLFQTLSLKIYFRNQKVFLEPEEKENIILSVHNRTRFPIRQIRIKVKIRNLTTGEKKKLRVKTALEAGENEVKVADTQRSTPLSYGVWQISCGNIKVYDLLQWFHLRKYQRAEQEVIRLPRRYEVNLTKGTLEYDAVWDQEEYEPWKTGSDASHIREIREYRPGDKTRSIHWKLSAKKEQLLVKEYGQPTGEELAFGIDVKRLTTQDMELIYSLLYACARKGISLFLVWRSEKKQELMQWEIKQEEDAYWAMECLMREKPVEWDSQMSLELEHQLWLKDRVLYLNDVEIQDFSKGELQEKLLDMELRL